MEEVIEHLRVCCAGKSAEEIADEIRASSHAEAIEDPDALAAYFVSLIQT